jgi:hypothetical protein
VEVDVDDEIEDTDSADPREKLKSGRSATFRPACQMRPIVVG